MSSYRELEKTQGMAGVFACAHVCVSLHVQSVGVGGGGLKESKAERKRLR